MGFVCINCVVMNVLEYNGSVICEYNLISYDILWNNSDILWNNFDILWNNSDILWNNSDILWNNSDILCKCVGSL
jgi:hypothetical protein